jgi:hypothetical protein
MRFVIVIPYVNKFATVTSLVAEFATEGNSDDKAKSMAHAYALELYGKLPAPKGEPKVYVINEKSLVQITETNVN